MKVRSETGPRPGPGRRHAEHGGLLEVERLLDAAGLGEHHAPPEAPLLVTEHVERRQARLRAGGFEQPAVDGVAAERAAVLRDHARFAAERSARRELDERHVHRAAADVDHQHAALVRQAQAVAERRRDRLVHEAHAAHAQVHQQALHLGAVGLEGGDGRRHDQVADSMAGRALGLGQQLAQVEARELARAQRPAAHARERTRGLARERGLEGRSEGRVRDVEVALERALADERALAEEESAGERRPAAQPVDEPGPLEDVYGRRHHARRLQRVVALGVAADRSELDEPRLARLVAAGDPGIGGAEIQGPAGHAGFIVGGHAPTPSASASLGPGTPCRWPCAGPRRGRSSARPRAARGRCPTSARRRWQRSANTRRSARRARA